MSGLNSAEERFDLILFCHPNMVQEEFIEYSIAISHFRTCRCGDTLCFLNCIFVEVLPPARLSLLCYLMSIRLAQRESCQTKIRDFQHWLC